MIPDKYKTVLENLGTDLTSHSGRSLYHHLDGVYALLKKWNNPEEISLAGLFHSIYGTQSFKTQTVLFENRNIIKSEIGSAAEELVYLFCTTDRATFFSSAQVNGRHKLKNLHDIEDIEVDYKFPKTKLLDTLIEKNLKLSDIKRDKTLNNWYKNHLTIFKELIFDLKGL